MEMDVSLTYTSGTLVEEALALGYQDVSRRLIYDWSNRGLLDQPSLYSPGRRGRPDAFPPSQHELFLTLLEKRKSRTKHILGLYNVPVFVWLWWGDDYIPLRQVRRAMNTWGRSCLSPSLVADRRSAREFLRQMNLPQYARGRKALKEALENVTPEICAGRHPDQVDWHDLETKLCKVWNKEGTGEPRGPVDAPVTPNTAISLLRVRYTALVSLEQYDDQLFEWARWFYRQTSSDYGRHVRDLAKDPEFGHLHRAAATAEHLVNHACVDLLTTLGTAPFIPWHGTLWDPVLWKNRKLRLTRTGEVVTEAGIIVSVQETGPAIVSRIMS